MRDETGRARMDAVRGAVAAERDVAGSRRGGSGARRPSVAGLGRVDTLPVELVPGGGPRDTTVIWTNSPERLINSTTRSWLAAATSSPFICKCKIYYI